MVRFLRILSILVAISFVGAALAGARIAPVMVDGTTRIDAVKAKQLFDSGVVFVDVSKDKYWQRGRIPDAVHLELRDAFSNDELGRYAQKDQQVVIYCGGPSCARSAQAAAQAVDWGYRQVYYYREGFSSWKAAGYPVEQHLAQNAAKSPAQRPASTP